MQNVNWLEALKSRTVLWAVGTFIVVTAGKYGVVLDEATVNSILMDVINAIGTVATVFYRINAVRQLKNQP